MVLMLVIGILMARRPKRQYRRKGGRRGMGRYIKGTIQQELDLGTLASRTLVGVANANTVTEKAWVSSMKATWTIDDFTSNAGDGPIAVGVAHSDYSDAEIEAWIENSGGWSEGNLVQDREVGRRLIRQVGVITMPSGSAASSYSLNDGRPVKTKLGWMLITGQTLRFWAYNLGESALDTTDADLQVFGHANLWPR